MICFCGTCPTGVGASTRRSGPDTILPIRFPIPEVVADSGTIVRYHLAVGISETGTQEPSCRINQSMPRTSRDLGAAQMDNCWVAIFR